jgi:ADP-heptose:LPS heptosyltransferase
MASPLNQQLVTHDPAFDAVHLYRKNILVDLPLVRRLRKKRFDIIFDPICHDSVTGLMLTKLIANDSVAAAARKLELQRFYDYCEPFQPDGQEHNIDNSLLIFNLFGIDPKTIDPFLPVHLPEEAITKAAAFVKAIENDKTFTVGLNISAGSPSRTLEIAKYEVLLDGIAREHPTARFVVICTKDDRERGRSLAHGRKGRVHLVPEGLSLLDAAAVIGRVDLFISPDTSLIHIARLMKVPVVGLYSGHLRNYHFWKPYRQEYGSVVSSHEGHLHDIEPEQVIREFSKVAAGIDPKKAATPSQR